MRLVMAVAFTVGLVIGLQISAGAQDTTSLLSAFLVNLRNGVIQLTGTTQASLGTVVSGQIKYCSDCTIASPCAGGGTGAIAKGLNGSWVCN